MTPHEQAIFERFPSVKRMHDLFPQAIYAIAWCETFVGPTKDSPEDLWPDLAAVEGGLEEAVSIVTAMIVETIMEFPNTPNLDKALEETGTKDFRRYMASKMGMM